MMRERHAADPKCAIHDGNGTRLTSVPRMSHAILELSTHPIHSCFCSAVSAPLPTMVATLLWIPCSNKTFQKKFLEKPAAKKAKRRRRVGVPCIGCR